MKKVVNGVAGVLFKDGSNYAACVFKDTTPGQKSGTEYVFAKKVPLSPKGYDVSRLPRLWYLEWFSHVGFESGNLCLC